MHSPDLNCHITVARIFSEQFTASIKQLHATAEHAIYLAVDLVVLVVQD
jgi:hypothetical protein